MSEQILPQVSVIIPCYNHGAYLEEAIGSVYAQTSRAWEIIVVNDGSTDPFTLEVLEKLPEQGVTVLEQVNSGPAVARNLGISKAQGQYILPLDADDRIAPDYLEKTIAVLGSQPDVGAVYGSVELFGARSGLWDLPDFDERLLLFENMVIVTALYRRQDFVDIGGYCETMRAGWEDWDFWLSMTQRNKRLVRLQDIVFYYRINQQTFTTVMSLWQKINTATQLVWRHKRLYCKNFRYCLFRALNWSKQLSSPR